MKGRLQRKYVVTLVTPDWLAALVRDVAHYQCIGVEDAVRQCVLTAVADDKVLMQLAPYFWQDYYAHGRYYPANPECRNLSELTGGAGAITAQFHVQLTRSEWFLLDGVAYALCRTIHQAASALLRLAVQHPPVLSAVAPVFWAEGPWRNGEQQADYGHRRQVR